MMTSSLNGNAAFEGVEFASNAPTRNREVVASTPRNVVTQNEALEVFDQIFNECSNDVLTPGSLRTYDLFTPNQTVPNKVYAALQLYVRNHPDWSLARREATPSERKTYRVKGSAKAYFVFLQYQVPTDEEASSPASRDHFDASSDPLLGFAKSKTSAFTPARCRLGDFTNSSATQPSPFRSQKTPRVLRATSRAETLVSPMVDPNRSFVPLVQSPRLAASPPMRRPLLMSRSAANALSSPLSPYMPSLLESSDSRASRTDWNAASPHQTVMGAAPQRILPGDFVYGDVVRIVSDHTARRALVVGAAPAQADGVERLVLISHHCFERLHVPVSQIQLLKGMPRWSQSSSSSSPLASGRCHVPK